MSVPSLRHNQRSSIHFRDDLTSAHFRGPYRQLTAHYFLLHSRGFDTHEAVVPPSLKIMRLQLLSSSSAVQRRLISQSVTRSRPLSFNSKLQQRPLSLWHNARPVPRIGSQTPSLPVIRPSNLSRISIRILSTKPLHAPTSRIGRFFIRTLFYLGTFVAFGTTFIVCFFIYDASTYGATPSIESLPVSSLALNPRRGGPKNLPIAEHFIDDGDCEHKYASKHKPRLVLLGTGWGSVAVLKNLNPEDYHVTVISPSNQFLFTPMLPSATVGTLELRSLVEPVRGIVNRVHGHFLKAMSVDIAFSEKLVEVESVDGAGKTQNFYIPYDKLVIGCGESRFCASLTCLSLTFDV